MPRLHKYRDRNACYVLTAIRGAVVTFQLTTEGEQKLATARIGPETGQTIDSRRLKPLGGIRLNR